MQNQVPPGALSPGTKLTVGSHQVSIKSYISEGGFAHVYVVYILDSTSSANEIACLKRVQVPDKMHLNLLRAEVDAMKRLKGHPNIVEYRDSHAARLPHGNGYEVLLLMEYCSGNGLIDFMNTRLRDQLKEHEILKIMYDITYGLSAMHYLQPALIHRDLKIENVLISEDGTFKLCDFGSSSPVLRPPRNPQEFHILEEDIQRHTTAQYRSPEMIDIYRGFPIDEKSDIWALGVFLYKLCYYTTPFEREGQLAILHANYSFPSRPPYSERLKRVIQATLREDPRNRPNVYQLLKEVCLMRGVEVPVKDIYTEAMQKLQQRQNQKQDQTSQRQDQSSQAPSPVPQYVNTPSQGAQVVQNQGQQKERAIPEVTPMYRGRPKNNPQSNSSVALNSINSANPEESNAVFSDPFALLDSSMKQQGRSSSRPHHGAQLQPPQMQSPAPPTDDDEAKVSSKFPTVEELTKNLEQKTFFFDSPSITPINSHSQSESEQVAGAKTKNNNDDQDQTRWSYEKSPPEIEITASPNIMENSSVSSSSSDDDEGPPVIPRRPHRPPQSQQKQPVPPPKPPRQRPKSMYATKSPIAQDDDPQYHQQQQEQQQEQNLIDTVPQDDRDELKSILTGLSQRSNTVVLDDDNHIDSNVEFLKSLEDDQTSARRSSSHHRKPSGNTLTTDWRSIRRTGSAASRKSLDAASRKSLDSSSYEFGGDNSYGNLTGGGYAYNSSNNNSNSTGSNSWKMRRAGSSSSHHSKKSSLSSIKGKIGDAFRKFENGSPVSRERGEMPPPPPPRTVSGGAIERSSNYSGLGSSGKFSYSTESLVSSSDDYKFPKPIQSRVNTFLNQQLSESPPKKTASGYGKYTDDGDEPRGGDSNTGDGDRKYKRLPTPPTLPRHRQSMETPPPLSSTSTPTSMIAGGAPEPRSSTHGRQLSVISSASSSEGVMKKAPTKPSKPVHLRSSPQRMGRKPVAGGETADERHVHDEHDGAEDWEAKFNQKYPSLNF